MDRVAPSLSVGTAGDAADREALAAAGDTAIVGLTHEPPAEGYPGDAAVARHPLTTARAVGSRTSGRPSTTSSGRSTPATPCSSTARPGRPGVAAAAIAPRSGTTPVSGAFERVERGRPAADPHPALRRLAARYVESV